jgi:hypothetical protein
MVDEVKDIDYSCKTDSDCTIKATKYNCCGKQFECVNADYKVSVNMTENPLCTDMIRSQCYKIEPAKPTVCACVANRCQATLREPAAEQPVTNNMNYIAPAAPLE